MLYSTWCFCSLFFSGWLSRHARGFRPLRAMEKNGWLSREETVVGALLMMLLRLLSLRRPGSWPCTSLGAQRSSADFVRASEAVDPGGSEVEGGGWGRTKRSTSMGLCAWPRMVIGGDRGEGRMQRYLDLQVCCAVLSVCLGGLPFENVPRGRLRRTGDDERFLSTRFHYLNPALG